MGGLYDAATLRARDDLISATKINDLANATAKPWCPPPTTCPAPAFRRPFWPTSLPVGFCTPRRSQSARRWAHDAHRAARAQPRGGPTAHAYMRPVAGAALCLALAAPLGATVRSTPPAKKTQPVPDTDRHCFGHMAGDMRAIAKPAPCSTRAVTTIALGRRACWLGPRMLTNPSAARHHDLLLLAGRRPRCALAPSDFVDGKSLAKGRPRSRAEWVRSAAPRATGPARPWMIQSQFFILKGWHAVARG